MYNTSCTKDVQQDEEDNFLEVPFSHIPSHINKESSKTMVNNEYFTLTLIIPFSTQSFAPVTTQYPGEASGPLTISFVSTKCDIFGALAGEGGPPGYTAEFKSNFSGSFRGGWFRAELKGVVINIDINPDFFDVAVGPSHSDLRMMAEATVENPSLRKRTFFKPMPFTSNQALVTIEAESSNRAPWYSTGAVHMWENMLHLTGSK